MPPTTPNADELDAELSLAGVALTATRAVFRRCPTAENARRVQFAEAELDRLLDRRLAAAVG
jgi:hypothetical protein